MPLGGLLLQKNQSLVLYAEESFHKDIQRLCKADTREQKIPLVKIAVRYLIGIKKKKSSLTL